MKAKCRIQCVNGFVELTRTKIPPPFSPLQMKERNLHVIMVKDDGREMIHQ